MANCTGCSGFCDDPFETGFDQLAQPMVCCSVQPIDTAQPTGFNQQESFGSNFQESFSSNFTAQPMDPYDSGFNQLAQPTGFNQLARPTGFNQLAQPTFQSMDPFSSNFMVPTVSQSMDPFSSNFNESFGSNFNESFGSNFNQLVQPMESFGSNFTVQPMESFGSNFTAEPMVGSSPQPTSSSYMDMLGDSNYITITQPQVRWI